MARKTGNIRNIKTTTYTIHKEPVIVTGVLGVSTFFILLHKTRANMTCCSRRDANRGKITTLLRYQTVTNPMITCHIPIIVTTGKPLTPDLERQREGKADPAWSYHSRWICQICLLGLMEMLSGKCNDLCLCKCVCVCLPPPSTVPIALDLSGENSVTLLWLKDRSEPFIT